MGYFYQRTRARRFLYWAFVIIALIGVMDHPSLKTPPEDIYLTPVASGHDPVRFLGLYDDAVWIEFKSKTRGWALPGGYKMPNEVKEYQLTDKDHGYYYMSAEAIQKKFVGHSFEEIDGHPRMATKVINKQDGGFEANYDMLAAIKSDGKSYRTQLSFDKDGYCRAAIFNEEIKDRNSLLLKQLPYVQAIMGWSWLTYHTQESLYIPSFMQNRTFPWYLGIILSIAYAIFLTIWAMAPPFLPVFLLLSCMLFDFSRNIPKRLVKDVSYLLLIVSAYIWMIPILCWGYPWIIGVPIGLFTILIGFYIISSFFEGIGSSNTYYKMPDRDVMEKIKPIISYQLGVDEYEITMNAQLGNDLGCDELDFYEILEKIENDLKVEFPKNKHQLEQIITVGDLVSNIKKYN